MTTKYTVVRQSTFCFPKRHITSWKLYCIITSTIQKEHKKKVKIKSNKKLTKHKLQRILTVRQISINCNFHTYNLCNSEITYAPLTLVSKITTFQKLNVIASKKICAVCHYSWSIQPKKFNPNCNPGQPNRRHHINWKHRHFHTHTSTKLFATELTLAIFLTHIWNRNKQQLLINRNVTSDLKLLSYTTKNCCN